MFCVLSLKAAYLENEPQTIVQPDGSVIHCFVTGDEFYNWLHDENYYTIVKDSKTGYYKYAVIKNDELVPSEYTVGKVDPENTELMPRTNISTKKILAKRNEFWKNTPIPANLKRQTLSSGAINNLVVYIHFSDEAEFTDDTITYWNMFNNKTTGYSSMYNYYKEVSYNALGISTYFYPKTTSTVISYQDSHDRNYYKPYDASTNTEGYQGGDNGTERTNREHALLRNAVNYVASQVPTSLNLDYNNDGYVDNVCFVVSGGVTAWATLLWPHRWSLYSLTANINGKRVYDYNFQVRNSLLSSGVGVLCHEMFHTLGAPDLYHYSQDGFNPCGRWDIMANNTNPPQHMTTFMKYRYGEWISNIPKITTNGRYTLKPVVSTTNNCYRINSPNSTTEYAMLEYRRKTGTFENSIYSSGLIIYRINSLADGDGNADGPPDEVYVYRPNGDTANDGSISTGYFRSGSGRTNFNNLTNPFSFLSDGTDACFDIYNISAADTIISFNVFIKPDIIPNADTIICSGDSILLKTPNLQNTTYKWKKNGFYISGETDTVLYAKTSGIYEIEATRYNCATVSTEVDVSVQVCSKINEKNRIQVFEINPNPAKDYLNFKITNSCNQKIIYSIIDITGRKIVEKCIYNTSNNFTTTVNISDYSKGMYFIKLKTQSNEIIRKFTKI